ncbi:hypothetical protein [Sphingomonas bacterium]|uniref:hypothetical protein n=1 Tax=Sphingomonas bacterium TaxID=1895847 RepID=UPI0020C735D5|nr:hypothetical protein [Sphingomonas bacterium]
MTVRSVVRRRPGPAIVVAAALLLSLIMVFRVQLASGFDLGFGDRADGLIEIAILEHWRNVWTGHAGWTLTGYFHPHSDTLGYNDGYFLYGVTYSLWRIIADPFLADGLNVLAWKAFGFLAAFRLCSATFRWDWRTACLVATLWTVSNNLFVQAGHAQLASVALLPFVLTLATSAARNEIRGSRWKAWLGVAALSATLGAWLLTSFYMAWFTLFSACLYGSVWLLLGGRRAATRMFSVGREHAATLTWSVLSLAIAVAPFAAVYLPKLRESGGESYAEMRRYLATPLVDMINVGPGNYAWGWMFAAIANAAGRLFPSDPRLAERVFRGEHEAGIPIVTFLLFATAAWFLGVRRRTAAGEPVSQAWRVLAICTAVGWLLTFQMGALSPWGAAYWLVPGARGIRVVLRYELWLTLPTLLVAAAAWRDRLGHLRTRRPWLWALAIATLFAENLTSESAARLQRSRQTAAFDAVSAPPEGCRAFYVVSARRSAELYRGGGFDAVYPHNVDAMFLAQRWRVPTVNGFSTFTPPDWAFASPTAGDYDARVARYVAKWRMDHVCRLDMRSRSPWRVLAAPGSGDAGASSGGGSPGGRSPR